MATFRMDVLEGKGFAFLDSFDYNAREARQKQPNEPHKGTHVLAPFLR